MSLSGVWRDLAGQEKVVDILKRAVAGETHAMTHAWLFTGPPGSGRSNAAKAFAAALQCDRGGCHECQQCRTTLAGSHPDVTLVSTDALSIKVAEIRELITRAGMSPTIGKYQIIIVEDADRMTEQGANALLKSLEEPTPKTVWMLCAPAARDVVVTIASRCRQVDLVVPSQAAIIELIKYRDQAPEALAAYAARVSQGHIGRARALATVEAVRERRNEILRLPSQLKEPGDAFLAAAKLVAAAEAEAKDISAEMDLKEREELQEFMALKGKKTKSITATMKQLEEKQKVRATRLKRDSLDRVLTDLSSYFRDVLVLQTAANNPIINVEQRADLEARAAVEKPERTIANLDAILACRKAIMSNVSPMLAVEALLLQLRIVDS